MSQQEMDAKTLDPQRLLSVLTALDEGDFSQRLPTGQEGAAGAIADSLNRLIDRLQAVAAQINRITTEVATGKFGGQAQVVGVPGAWSKFPTREDIECFLNGAQAEDRPGAWKEMIDNLNGMSATLTHQIRDIATVIWELTKGNSSQKVTVIARGEMLQLKEMLNTLVDQADA